jgi:hypothetical protein
MDNLSQEQIKEMISLLQSMLTKDVPSGITDDEPKIAESNYSIKTRDKKPRVSSINKFDSMTEANLHKDDVEIDKKLAKYAPTPRVRKFQPISVVCRICGKKESISPTLIHDNVERYKCNKCSQGAG